MTKLTDVRVGNIDGVPKPLEADIGKAFVYAGSDKFGWYRIPVVDIDKLAGIEARAEKNEATSLGTGLPVYAGKDGSRFKFKSIKAGNGVSVTANGSEVIISSAAGTEGSSTLLGLSDVPDAYPGAGRALVVNPANNGATFSAPLGTAAFADTTAFAAASHDHSAATSETSGFLSAADKGKLDSIETNAEVNSAANRGTGTPLFAGKAEGSLQFRSLRVEGGGLTVTHDDDDIVISGSAGAGDSFIGLADTPAAFSGANNKVVKVNATGNGLEFGSVLGSAAFQNTGYFAAASHTHAYNEVVGVEAYIDARVAATGGITKVQGDSFYSPLGHVHTIANVTGLQTALDGKAATSHTHDDRYYTEAEVDVALAGKAAASHTHTIANVTGLQSALDGKAASAHTHTTAQVTGLDTALAGKAASSHTHATAEVTGLDTALAGKFDKAGGTLSGTVNAQDNTVQRPLLQDIAEKVNALGAVTGTATVNLESGNVVTATVTGATTWTFTNPPASGRSGTFTLRLTNGGSAAQTWPSSVKCAGGTAPTLTAAGRDRLVFTTEDAGATWDLVALLKDFK